MKAEKYSETINYNVANGDDEFSVITTYDYNSDYLSISIFNLNTDEIVEADTDLFNDIVDLINNL